VNVGTPLGLPLHPTQLYDAGAELIILGIILATERRWRPYGGRTFWLYILLYAISRFIIEFFRGDERGMVFGVLSTSQFVSVLILPISLLMLLRLRGTSAAAPAVRRA
jgi:phosphatidylglycerol:prolipoprotein diacylglycerol transferase